MGEVIPASPAEAAHRAIVEFLHLECGVCEKLFDQLVIRLHKWGVEHANTHGIAVNPFNPMMLLEQCRKEFDETVSLIEFSMAVADLQMGPRLVQLPSFDKPVWVVAFQGFPEAIEKAKQFVAARDATLAERGLADGD